MISQAKAEVWSGELSLHECAQVATLVTVESEILLQQNGGLIRMGHPKNKEFRNSKNWNFNSTAWGFEGDTLW